MKLSFHISFPDGSNPYYSFPKEASKTIKEVNRWYKNHPFSKFDIYPENHKYRITNTQWSTWVIYRCGKCCDAALKEYTWLSNAVKFLEKEIQKTT